MKSLPVAYATHAPETGNWTVPVKPAQIFKPTYRESRVRLMTPPLPPRIEMSFEAFVKMYLFVNYIGLEVGWLGTVDEIVPGIIYRIADVYMFKQSIGIGHTDIDSTAFYEFINNLSGRSDFEYIFNNTRFWGHSHVEGGTSPSSQDEDQMNIFAQQGSSWFLRGILNRRGEIDFSFFNWNDGLIFDHVPWSVVAPQTVDRDRIHTMKDEVLEEMRNMVTEKAAPILPASYYGRQTVFPKTLKHPSHQTPSEPPSWWDILETLFTTE